MSTHQVEITVDTIGLTFGWKCKDCGAADGGFDNRESAVNAAYCYHRQVMVGNGRWEAYRAEVAS